jgi:hypothetical protein
MALDHDWQFATKVTKLKWKLLNEIKFNGIRCLLWSDMEGFIIVYYYTKANNYSYHLVNAISLALSQSDHIKPLLL